MLLGYARGALGDVVFKRVNGEQVETPRVRHPHNPNSDRQQYQRAIMATITRAYAAGNLVFDHSFEGLQTGAQCQAVFMRENLKILRRLVSQEYRATPDAEYGHLGDKSRLVVPSVLTPIGFDGMLISKGTYGDGIITVDPITAGSPPYERTSFRVPPPSEDETCAEYAAKYGVVADDYYTLCGFVCWQPGMEYPRQASEWENEFIPGSFFFLRLHTKEEFISSINFSYDALWDDLFEIDEVYDPGHVTSLLSFGSGLISQAFTYLDILDPNIELSYYGGCWLGFAHSHKNLGLRSTSYLYRARKVMMAGITPNRILDNWRVDQNGGTGAGSDTPVIAPFFPFTEYVAGSAGTCVVRVTFGESSDLFPIIDIFEGRWSFCDSDGGDPGIWFYNRDTQVCVLRQYQDLTYPWYLVQSYLNSLGVYLNYNATTQGYNPMNISYAMNQVQLQLFAYPDYISGENGVAVVGGLITGHDNLYPVIAINNGNWRLIDTDGGEPGLWCYDKWTDSIVLVENLDTEIVWGVVNGVLTNREIDLQYVNSPEGFDPLETINWSIERSL